MTFIRGRVFLPKDVPFVQPDSWGYVSQTLAEEEEIRIPLADALVRARLKESGALITKTRSNEEGEFFLRLPPREKFVLEVVKEKKILVAGLISVEKEREIDVGTLDSSSTAWLLAEWEHLAQGGAGLAPLPFRLRRWAQTVEDLWRNNCGLLDDKKISSLWYQKNTSNLDPFCLFKHFDFEWDKKERVLKVSWSSEEKVVIRLFYRSFRSVYYRKKEMVGTRGEFLLENLREFEGYLFYLEAHNQKGRLARTPTFAFRVPIIGESQEIELIGNQEGPAIIERRQVSGKRIISFGQDSLELDLNHVFERKFEAELNFEFSRKFRIPRYFIREGFSDLELSFYFPHEFSSLWGRKGKVDLFGLSEEEILCLWQKIPVEIPPHYLLEIGVSLPFAELVSYRSNSYYRLFSSSDLQQGVLVLLLRDLDSLDLPSVAFYRGNLTLQGEGLFEGYCLEIDFEGKFEEDVNNKTAPSSFSYQETKGRVYLQAELQIRKATVQTFEGKGINP
ncbi:MAG: hypothetical protein PWP04_1415 [Candidatus Atribacteria bacterium]|nr:hypothetical protein [Candidatus Atribacteria bacterium]